MTAFWPGCNCCGTCVIDTEEFDSDLSAWDEISGSWSVGSGVLTCNTAGVLLRAAETGSSGVVIARMKGTSSGDTASVIVGSNSSGTTFIEARIEFGSNCGECHIYDGGVKVTSASTHADLAASTDWIEIAVYYRASFTMVAWRKLTNGTQETIVPAVLPSGVGGPFTGVATYQRAVQANVSSTGTYAGLTMSASTTCDEWIHATTQCFSVSTCAENSVDVDSGVGVDLRPLTFILAGQWYHAADGTAADTCEADIITVDANSQVHEVELLASGITERDRQQGYAAYAQLNNLNVNSTLTDRDIFSLFLDGGSHEVRIRYEEFSAISGWGSFCQTIPTMTILIQLWRGATKLAERRCINEGNVNGMTIGSVFGSLHGDVFCGGVTREATAVSNSLVVQATTTSTHNGPEITAEILDPGSLSSTQIAIIRLCAVRCWQCPGCASCDEITDDPTELMHTSELSIYIPSYKMPLFSGSPVSCTGGTFVADYEGDCVWSHGSDGAHIKLSIDTSSGMIRLKMRIFSCAGYTCSGFEQPLPSTWYSADLSGSDVLCDGFSAVDVSTTVSGITYTAEVTST